MRILNDILIDASKKYPNNVSLTMKISYRQFNMTFKEVYDNARKIALFLLKNGIKKNDKILIFSPNSPMWCTIFWGSILNGSIVVPINIQNKSDQINRIIEQTNAKIIFQSHFLKRKLKDVKIFYMEFLDDYISKFNPNDFSESHVTENDTVEILYTSGTTGDPKGVILTHKNICSNIKAITELEMIAENKDRLLSILPLTHIFEQTIGFFLPFYYKVQIVYTHSYSAISDLLKEHKITKMIAVPEFLKIIISKIKANVEKKGKIKLFNKMIDLSIKINNKYISKILFRAIHKNFGGKLDTIACGGAFLSPSLEKEWNALGITLLQGYGLTETSPILTANTYKEHKFGSVGKVIGDTKVKISEKEEILAKGPNVFSGYYKNEEKTKSAFTLDGWFKTGDIGKFDDDDFLFLRGRLKYVIQGPGGQLVYPEDIEKELNRSNLIKDSAVIGIEEESGMVEIHAVLLLEQKNINTEQIIDNVNEKLASYQRINAYTIWPYDDFPRSATKKIKKEDVIKFVKNKKSQKNDLYLQSEITPLIKILSQITGISEKKIRPESKILSNLKIDSLMWVELVGRIDQAFGISIDETIVSQKTTVNDIEKIIKKGEPPIKPPKLASWPRTKIASIIRIIGQFLGIAFYRIFIKLKVSGLENLKGLNFPVIIMPNHISYLDPLVLLAALPIKTRLSISFAAARDVLYEEFKYVSWLGELFANAFALPRKEGENISLGLDYMGKMLDNNYSVVVFPEGRVSLDGKFQDLKMGTGLIAVEMRCPVIPVKISGTEKITPYSKLFPRKFGTVTVKFGKPIRFKRSTSYQNAIDEIYARISSL